MSKEDKLNFLAEERNRDLMEKYVLRAEEDDDLSDDDLDYESEMSEIELELMEEASEDLSEDNSKSNSALQFKSKRDDYRMSKEDKKILNKVSGLSFLVIVVVVCIITISAMIRFTEIVKYFMSSILTIFISFSLEMGSIVVVYFLFVKDLTTKEYKNLKVIGEVTD